MVTLLITATLVCLLAGIPFAFSVLIGVVLSTLLAEPSQLSQLPALALSNIDDPLLIAIPILVMAGEILTEVGALDYLIDLVNFVVGGIRGALGLTCVGASLFFAGSTGSSAAEAAAVAGAFQQPMAQRGYSRGYVAPLIAVSTAVGVLFPPSLAMILYSETVNFPVTKLWQAGILPGLMTGLLVAVVAFGIARRSGQGKVPAGGRGKQAQPGAVPAGAATSPTAPGRAAADPRADDEQPGTRRQQGGVRHTVALVTGLLIPVFVVGGIYSGILTLSEVAAALVAIVVLYGLTISRVGPRRLLTSARRGGKRAAAVFVIVIAARLFSNILVEQQTITHLITSIGGMHLARWELLLGANIAMIIAGTLMDGLSLIIIAAPVLFQLLSPVGVSPEHLAIIMAMNIEIGVVHPPFGGNLFAVSAITGVSVGRIARNVLPYIAVLLTMLAIVTYVPFPGFAWN